MFWCVPRRQPWESSGCGGPQPPPPSHPCASGFLGLAEFSWPPEPPPLLEKRGSGDVAARRAGSDPWPLALRREEGAVSRGVQSRRAQPARAGAALIRWGDAAGNALPQAAGGGFRVPTGGAAAGIRRRWGLRVARAGDPAGAGRGRPPWSRTRTALACRASSSTRASR